MALKRRKGTPAKRKRKKLAIRKVQDPKSTVRASERRRRRK